MKKRILSVITIILTVMLCVCAVGFSAGADENVTPTVSIDKFNLVFDDNVYLKYAVKFDGIDDSAINSSNIGMLYFTAPQSEYIEGNENYSSGVVGFTTISDQKYYTFEYRHITAKQMTDYIYSVAYIDVDGVRHYSAPAKYSVLEYVYSKLGKTGEASTNDDFKAMLESMLEYGANAQKYFNYNTERLANDDYYLIEVIGGTLEDGFTKGLYHTGETATLTAPETSGELVFAGWKNSANEDINSDTSIIINNIIANETYTAIYTRSLEFTSNGDGTCYVSGLGTSIETDLTIPKKSPYGDTVTGIGTNAFKNAIHITKVTLPDSLKNINYGAFYGCTNLTSITIPNSVTTIGSFAFYNCSGIIEIENGVSYVDKWVINCDTSVEYVVLRENTVGIANSAFDNCDNLYDITIPDSVTSIGNCAFECCTRLESITISNSVTFIGNGAFVCCDELVSIIIPDNLTVIENNTFNACRNLTSITIPNSVTSIGENAFSSCESLTDVYYTGTEEEWNSINISTYGNSSLLDATIHFNYIPEE